MNQVYLWPSSRDRTANAAAVVGQKVLLTDYLLQHMSKRQVDWVVAHELVHLRHRHPGKGAAAGLLGIGFMVSYLAILYVQQAALMFPDFQSLFGTLFQLRYGFMLVLFMGFLWVRNVRMREMNSSRTTRP